MTPLAATAATQWSVWSTTVRLIVTEPDTLTDAKARVERLIAEVDRAASRFRPDSEVHAVLSAGGRPVPVSPLMADLVRAALNAAAESNGDVDPTIGAWLCELGYDRDLANLPALGAQPRVSLRLAPDWRQVRLGSNETGDELTVPDGVLLDLGATAKAYAADLCAAAVAELGCGVLVSLGGDIATAGPAPHGGASARSRARRILAGPGAGWPGRARHHGHSAGRCRHRHIEHCASPMAPRRPRSAPHHRPPYRPARRTGMAHRHRGRRHLRSSQYRDHGSPDPGRAWAGLPRRHRSGGATGRGRRQRAHPQRVAH